MDWIYDESIRLDCPLFADELVGCEALEHLEPSAEVVGVDEVLKVPTQLFMTVVVEAPDGGVLDGSVPPLDLPVGPGMIDPGEPVLDAVLVADPIEDVVERVFVTDMVGELDAVVCQHRMDGVGNRRNEIAQEPGCDHLACLLMEFGIGELGRPVDPDEQAQLALRLFLPESWTSEPARLKRRAFPKPACTRSQPDDLS